MKKYFLLIIAFFLLYSSLIAAGRRIVIDSIRVNSNHLILNFRAEGVIDDKIAEGLRKGRTSTLEYKIQLWGKKSGLLNQLIDEQYIRMKVFYDFWENKFVIFSPNEKRMTGSLETVRETCTEISDFDFIDLTSLKPDIKYAIIVEIILRPLSVENYQEIKNWLNGEVKDMELDNLTKPDEQAKGMGGGFLRMFMAITGFGDRVLSCESGEFTVKDSDVVWQ